MGLVNGLNAISSQVWAVVLILLGIAAFANGLYMQPCRRSSRPDEFWDWNDWWRYCDVSAPAEKLTNQ